MAFDTTGREIASCSAAFAMLPFSATARNTCRSRGLRRRPMRFDHSMAMPVSNWLPGCRIIELAATSQQHNISTGHEQLTASLKHHCERSQRPWIVTALMEVSKNPHEPPDSNVNGGSRHLRESQR